MLGELTTRLKAKLPLRLKQVLRELRPKTRPFVCPVCGHKLISFNRVSDWYLSQLDKYQHIHSIFALETANLLQYECTACGATDRERLYAMYIRSRCKGLKKFVEFAPAPAISRFIKAIPGIEYRSADLFNPSADERIDLRKIPYADNTIDAFLSSHMLEHIDDDQIAMKELYRVLKPAGWGIVMVPIQLTLESTLEGLPIDSDADRWKFYGQHDHVRMYAKQDFVERLARAGFKVQQLGVDFFGKEAFEKHGIHPRSVLYVVEKPVALSSIG